MVISSPRRANHWRPGAAGVAAALAMLFGVLAMVDRSSGQADARSRHDGDTVTVVATTSVLADFARIVGVDEVEVRGLIRPNVDAHDFDPSPADLEALARADVILANGLGLEPWLDAAVEAAGSRGRVTDTSTGVHLVDLDGDPVSDPDTTTGGVNPHIWLDPRNARVMSATVTEAIAAALTTRPDGATEVRTRGAAYDRQLARLDSELARQLGGLTHRSLVTDHDAFAYFAQRYDLEVVGTVIPSFDTAAEVSAGDLADLADTVERTGTRAVFTEQALQPDDARALARRTGIEVVSGHDGLLGDSLAPAGSPGDTYLTMMRHNATAIARNLR